MFRKPITYTDYNGEVQTEDFYFNISPSKMTKMQYSVEGGMSDYLKKIVEDENGAELMETFRMLIAQSYGVRSADGRRFIQNDDIVAEFMETAAYEELFMELITNSSAAVEFCNGIMPANMVRAMEDVQLPEPKNYSTAELIAMDEAEFLSVVGPNQRNWTKDQLLVAMQRRNHSKAA
jgi:hypothetical protein